MSVFVAIVLASRSRIAAAQSRAQAPIPVMLLDGESGGPLSRLAARRRRC